VVQPGSPGIFRRKSSTAGTEPQQQVALPASKSRPRPSVGDILATKMAQSGAGATGLGWPNTKEDYDLLEVIGRRTAPRDFRAAPAATPQSARGRRSAAGRLQKMPICPAGDGNPGAGAEFRTRGRKNRRGAHGNARRGRARGGRPFGRLPVV